MNCAGDRQGFRRAAAWDSCNDKLSQELVMSSRNCGAIKPAAIEFVDALPKTETGKIQRFVLRERADKGEEMNADLPICCS